MNTHRRLASLLAPSVLLILVSIGSLFAYVQNNRAWQATVQNQPVHDRFVDDIKNGRRQPTTEQWITIVSAAHDWAEKERGLIRTNTHTLRDLGLFSLAIALLQILVVFLARKNWLKADAF
jgi:hypothetical protein